VPDPLHPGVYIEEVPSQVNSIAGVSTSTAGFIGVAARGVRPTAVASFAEFERVFDLKPTGYLSIAVRGFFENGGKLCYVTCIVPTDPLDAALDSLANEELSILCCPDERGIPNAAAALVAHCENRKDRMCILQSPEAVLPDASHALSVHSSYAAYYYPWLEVIGPDGNTITVPPAGHVCGVYARIDLERGVHKAPTNAPIIGVKGLSEAISTPRSKLLDSRGINVIRRLPGKGIILWGARTTSENPEWKYVNIRRLLIFIEQSLRKGLQWAVFEPNGPAVWARVRAAIEDFLLGLWQSNVLLGSKPEEAFFVSCDRNTMSQNDIDSGRVSVLVGVAPVRPAEFVIFRIMIQTEPPA
jgi:uncharacterized protein